MRRLRRRRTNPLTAATLLSLGMCLVTLALSLRGTAAYNQVMVRLGQLWLVRADGGGFDVEVVRGRVPEWDRLPAWSRGETPGDAPTLHEVARRDFRGDSRLVSLERGDVFVARHSDGRPMSDFEYFFVDRTRVPTTPRLPRWRLHVSYPFAIGLSAILPMTVGANRLRGAVRGKRRTNEGRCPACGYDLRATPDRCPECGHVPAASPRA